MSEVPPPEGAAPPSDPPEAPPDPRVAAPGPPASSASEPPAPAISPALPVQIPGVWQRSWRLGTELIGRGHIHVADHRLYVVGRRTNPLRSVLAIAWRLLSWFTVAAGAISVGLTAVGFGWRTSSFQAFLFALAVGLPVFGLLWALVRWIGGRILEPGLGKAVPWGHVTEIASNGRVVDLVVQTDQGTVHGRLVPRRWNFKVRGGLDAIRDARLPGGRGGDATRAQRPVWVDQAVMLAGIVSMFIAAWISEPLVTSALLGIGEPDEGPLAGVPAALEIEQVDARHAGRCDAGDESAPAITNRRDGDALVWTLTDGAKADWTTVHLRWPAGTTRIERVGSAGEDGDGGRIDGFFLDDHVLGVSFVVRREHAAAVRSLLDSRDMEALRSAWCAGLVGRMDVTRNPPPGQAPSVSARRRGSTLVVEVDDLRQGDRILPIRWRERPGLDLWDTCEVPVEGHELGLLRALPERRVRRFFVDEADRARVLLIPQESRAAAERLARAGAVQRCLLADSLVWAGVAHVLAETPDDRAHVYRDRAAAIVRATPLAPEGASAAVVLDAVARRWRLVAAELQLTSVGEEARVAARGGFLDALDWSQLIDTVSFTNNLPELEILRQRLEGASVDHTLGEQFLMRFAEEFLTRVPVEPATWQDRIGVGEAWLEVELGTEWTVAGGHVRVGTRSAADAYAVIGRFVLMDVARRVEEDLNSGRVGLVDLARSFWVRFRLKGHDISLDIEKSSARKALEAWVTGDWEYLIDRVTKKAQEKLRDEKAASAAAWKADYALQTRWTDGAAVRASTLLRDGGEVGWVMQMDGARTHLDYVMPNGAGTSIAALDDGRHLLLATAGSYVTGEGRTAGLSVLDGTVKNFLISPKMDGLVVIRGDGTLAVLDLRRGSPLPGTERVLRPLRSLSDFHALVSWLRQDGASAFQTHLFAADGVLTIDGSRASGTLRERRLLVDATYRGHPITAIVDIPGQHRQSIFEAAVVALKALETDEASGGPGLTVRSIANLDVGSYDILEAYATDGTLLRKAPQPLSSAMNLLVFRL